MRWHRSYRDPSRRNNARDLVEILVDPKRNSNNLPTTLCVDNDVRPQGGRSGRTIRLVNKPILRQYTDRQDL